MPESATARPAVTLTWEAIGKWQVARHRGSVYTLSHPNSRRPGLWRLDVNDHYVCSGGLDYVGQVAQRLAALLPEAPEPELYAVLDSAL